VLKFFDLERGLPEPSDDPLLVRFVTHLKHESDVDVSR